MTMASQDTIRPYRLRLGDELLDHLASEIFRIVRVEEKYLDPNYTAMQMAQELNTNVRYISAVMGVRYGVNYTQFVNKFRIEKAMQLLRDKRYCNVNLEDIGGMVGFSNRQSFYTAFNRHAGMTPREFRLKNSPQQK